MKINLQILFVTTALLILGTGVLAQTAPLSVQVMHAQSDGTKVPVSDALVELFRTDVKGKMPVGKTDKKGEFVFAGLSLGNSYILCVSAPDMKQNCLPGVETGSEKIVIFVVKGDGSRLSEDQIRQTMTNVPSSARTQSLNDSFDNGFMGIKYGASMSEVRKIITNSRLGRIDGTGRDPSELKITCDSNAKCNLGILSLGKRDFVGNISFLFYDDQFYNAVVTYVSIDAAKYSYSLFDALNRRYYETRMQEYEDDEIDDGERAIWTFKRTEGGNNVIILSYSYQTQTISVGLASPGLREEFSQAVERRQRFREVFSKGYDLLKEGKYDLAVVELTNAIKIDPGSTSVEAYHYRGHAYTSLKKYDLAVSDFNSALLFNPDYTHYLVDRALAYANWSVDKLDLALADLNRAVKLKSDDARPFILRAQIYCSQKKKELAIADEKEAIRLGGKITKSCEQ